MPNDMKKGDLISRKELLKMAELAKFKGLQELAFGVWTQYIMAAPAVDAAPVVLGRWKSASAWEGIPTWMCNKCNTGFGRMWSYCPNCGAKMDEEV